MIFFKRLIIFYDIYKLCLYQLAVWESTELFKNAVKNAELQSRLEKYPPSIVASPQLFKKVLVPGI